MGSGAVIVLDKIKINQSSKQPVIHGTTFIIAVEIALKRLVSVGTVKVIPQVRIDEITEVVQFHLGFLCLHHFPVVHKPVLFRNEPQLVDVDVSVGNSVDK
jgi:hypothetical protein